MGLPDGTKEMRPVKDLSQWDADKQEYKTKPTKAMLKLLQGKFPTKKGPGEKDKKEQSVSNKEAGPDDGEGEKLKLKLLKTGKDNLLNDLSGLTTLDEIEK